MAMQLVRRQVQSCWRQLVSRHVIAAGMDGSHSMSASDWKHAALRRASRGKPRWGPAGATVAAITVALIFIAIGRTWEASRQRADRLYHRSAVERSWAFQGGAVDTLVVYIFSDTDPTYAGNLKFFLRWGVRENDGAKYIIVLQQSQEAEVALPASVTSCLVCAPGLQGAGACLKVQQHQPVMAA